MYTKDFHVDTDGNGNRLLNWLLDPSCDLKELQGVKSIDSLNLVSNNLVIAFTKFDGSTGTVSQDMSGFAADVSVDNVTFTNPSSGVWNLNVIEDDGTTHTVNLASLLAVVVNSSSEITLNGNGTPENPLTATIKEIAADKILYDKRKVELLDAANVQEAIDELATDYDKLDKTRRWVSYRVDDPPTRVDIDLNLPEPMADMSSFIIQCKAIDKEKNNGELVELNVILKGINKVAVYLESELRYPTLAVEISYIVGQLPIGTLYVNK